MITPTPKIPVEINSTSGWFGFVYFNTLAQAEKFCVIIQKSNTLTAFVRSSVID